MSASGSGAAAEGGKPDAEVPFIFRWCDKYGLSEDTSAILLGLGINSVQHLLNIQSDDVKDLQIALNQKLLLRGALLQFKETDHKYAERRARKLKVPVEKALFLSKNAVIELQYNPITPLDTTDTLSSEELEKRLELRRRLRHKKHRQKAGLSLADRILNQRQDMLQSGSSVSLSSCGSFSSSLSRTSVSTLPAGRVTEPSTTTQRNAQSAHAHAHRSAPTNTNNNNAKSDMNKQIEEILMVDTEPVTAARSVSRGVDSASGKRCLDTTKSESRPVSTGSGKSRSSSALGAGVDINDSAETGVKAKVTAKTTDELIAKMDATLDRLLKEISDSVHEPEDTAVNNPKGDLKRAIDIMDNELVTAEERAMVAETKK